MIFPPIQIIDSKILEERMNKGAVQLRMKKWAGFRLIGGGVGWVFLAIFGALLAVFVPQEEFEIALLVPYMRLMFLLLIVGGLCQAWTNLVRLRDLWFGETFISFDELSVCRNGKIIKKIPISEIESVGASTLWNAF